MKPNWQQVAERRNRATWPMPATGDVSLPNPVRWQDDLVRREQEQAQDDDVPLPPRLAQYDRGSRWQRWLQAAVFLSVQALIAALLGAALGLYLLWLYHGAPT